MSFRQTTSRDSPSLHGNPRNGAGERRGGLPNAPITYLAKLECRQQRSRLVFDAYVGLIKSKLVQADATGISGAIADGRCCRALPADRVCSEIDFPHPWNIGLTVVITSRAFNVT